MFKFDRKTLFDGLRAAEGPLNNKQVDGLNILFDKLEQDPHVTDIRWAAYMLATTQHETAETYRPIREYGGRNYFIRRYGSQTRIGRQLGNDTPEEGAWYAGIGDVQLTGESNYERAEVALRREYPELVADFERRTGRYFDLTVGDQPNDERDPENAGDPHIAYAIMSYGMRHGMFTTRKLSDYFTKTSEDPREARRIINGMDKTDLIVGYYRFWKRLLVQATLPISKPMPDPSPASNAQGTLVPQPEPSQVGVSAISAPAIEQHADTIVNQNPVATPPASTETVSVPAPAKEGATATATKMVIGGIVVPPAIATVIEVIKGLITDGYVDAKEIGSMIIAFIKDNQRYLLWLIGGIIALLVVKKLLKQITLWISMLTAAIPSWNTVQAVPTEKEQV